MFAHYFADIPKHKRLNIEQSVGSCRARERSSRPAARHPHKQNASGVLYALSER
jgi:hypothetical protein